MNKLISSTMVAGLLLAVSACGSDDAASPASTASTPASTADSSASSAADTTPTSDGTTSVDVSGIGTLQGQVVTLTVAAAAAAGVTIDQKCFTAVAARLSDEDAQMIIDAGKNGSPTLSAAGEALGAEAAKCVLGVPTAESVTPTT